MKRSFFATLLVSFSALGGAAFLVVSKGGCVDPEGAFVDFDERVIDAARIEPVGSCNGGMIPDVNGEIYLVLSPVFAPEGLLQFEGTAVLAAQDGVTTLGLNITPICVQEAQCTVGETVGETIVIDPVEVSDSCTFTMDLVDVTIPGGANPISGSNILGNIELLGTLNSTDIICGIANGTANVNGTILSIDNSTFGSIRNNDPRPAPVVACPEETGDPDAGVPDVDAGLDAGPPDASVDAGT